MNTDKQNKVDYRWFVIRTLARQERKLGLSRSLVGICI